MLLAASKLNHQALVLALATIATEAKMKPHKTLRHIKSTPNGIIHILGSCECRQMFPGRFESRSGADELQRWSLMIWGGFLLQDYRWPFIFQYLSSVSFNFSKPCALKSGTHTRARGCTVDDDNQTLWWHSQPRQFSESLPISQAHGSTSRDTLTWSDVKMVLQPFISHSPILILSSSPFDSCR